MLTLVEARCVPQAVRYPRVVDHGDGGDDLGVGAEVPQAKMIRSVHFGVSQTARPDPTSAWGGGGSHHGNRRTRVNAWALARCRLLNPSSASR